MEMEQPQNIEDLKKEIIAQIADLSRLLGMIPSDDITVSDASGLLSGSKVKVRERSCRWSQGGDACHWEISWE